MHEFSIEAPLQSGAFFMPVNFDRFFLLGGLMVGLCMTYGRLIHNFSTLPNNLIKHHSFCFINCFKALLKLVFDFVDSLKEFDHILKLLGLIGCSLPIFINKWFHITQNNKRNNWATQKWIKGVCLPKTEKQPENLFLVLVTVELNWETIRTGRNKRFSAVISFVENEKMGFWNFYNWIVGF